MRRIILVLLPVVLLAFVCVSVTRTSADVSAQGMIEYEVPCVLVVEYELLWFEPDAWRSGVDHGCVVYESLVSKDDPTAEFALVPSKDWWPDVPQPPGKLELTYGEGEEVTVCGDTVHFRIPADIGG